MFRWSRFVWFILLLAIITASAGRAFSAETDPERPKLDAERPATDDGPATHDPASPAADDYEPDNTWQQAKDINVRDYHIRTISPAGDVDWAKLTIPAGQWSADFLATESHSGRLRLSLYDSALNLLESNDNNGSALIGRVCAVDPLPAGTYYLKVEEVNGNELIDYWLIWDRYEDCSKRPDLRPHTPPGYQYPVVPNSIKGTKWAETTLYAGKPTYFDWFFTNAGPGIPPSGYRSQLWVGNTLVVDQTEQGIAQGWVGGRDDWAYTVPTPGWRTVRLEVDATGVVDESNEQNNVWEMYFYWQPVTGWWAEFFNGVVYDESDWGDPVLVRDDPAIDFEWEQNSPGPGVGANYFSARWTRDVTFKSGVYRFNFSRDDGLRFYIDGQRVVDKWAFGVENFSIVESMSAGSHALRLEMMELEGYATAKLNWEPCYSLTTASNPSNGGLIAPWPPPDCGDEWFTGGTVIDLYPNENDGYVFSHWSGALSGSDIPATLTMDSDKSVTAHYIPLCYTLSTAVNPSNGGRIDVSPAPNCSGGRYTAGTTVTLTAVANSGYSFNNWSGALSGSNNPRTLVMDGDKSVTANFSAICYTLTINVNPAVGGNISPNPAPNCSGGRYMAGTQVTLTAVANSGYSFNNWSGALSGSNNPRTLVMDGDKSVTANFNAVCYSLSTNVNPSNGGRIDVSPAPNCSGGRYTAGTTVTLTAVANSGHSFSNWSGALSGSNNPRTLVMDGDKSVTANFNTVCYTLTTNVNPSNGGSIGRTPPPNCSGGRYTAGTQVTLTANANSGHSFNNWSGDLSGSTTPRTLVMNSDKSVTANFNTVCYILSTAVNPSNGGRIDVSPAPNCSGGRYTAGTTVTLTAVANSGNSFNNWSGALSGSTNPRTLVMNSDKMVTAHFDANCYTLTTHASPTGGGRIDRDLSPNCDGGRYKKGTQVTLTAVGNANYTFSNWSGALSGSTNFRTVIIDSNKSVTAHFKLSGPTRLFMPATLSVLCHPGDREIEPNDRFSMATTLFCFDKIYHGTLKDFSPDPSLNYDLFAYRLNTAGRISADVELSSSKERVELSLFKQGSSANLITDSNWANGLNIKSGPLQPGLYYIGLWIDPSHPNVSIDYTLWVTTE